jgi:hypothetical protein
MTFERDRLLRGLSIIVVNLDQDLRVLSLFWQPSRLPHSFSLAQPFATVE